MLRITKQLAGAFLRKVSLIFFCHAKFPFFFGNFFLGEAGALGAPFQNLCYSMQGCSQNHLGGNKNAVVTKLVLGIFSQLTAVHNGPNARVQVQCCES